MELDFNFAKFTEVTAMAFKLNPQYEANGYTRVFVCEDTHVFWVARIMAGFDENYQPAAGSFIVERNQVDKSHKSENLTGLRTIKLLKNDEFDNWDCKAYSSLDDAIESIDGGYGILCLQNDQDNQGDNNG